MAPTIATHGAASSLSAALLILLFGIGAIPAGAATCASLAGLSLPDTTITAAEPVVVGTYTAPDGEMFTNLPAFCRIAATLTPTSDSNINIEVWVPYSCWNGRFLGTGNAGIAGLIVWRTFALFLPLNSAVANTDIGTSPAATAGGRMLTGHPEKQIDFATRSTNLMTVRSKQIIKAFYGENPKYSYFSGCSTGGGQGVHEALQFPGDYGGMRWRMQYGRASAKAASVIWYIRRRPGGLIDRERNSSSGATANRSLQSDYQHPRAARARRAARGVALAVEYSRNSGAYCRPVSAGNLFIMALKSLCRA